MVEPGTRCQSEFRFRVDTPLDCACLANFQSRQESPMPGLVLGPERRANARHPGGHFSFSQPAAIIAAIATPMKDSPAMMPAARVRALAWLTLARARLATATAAAPRKAATHSERGVIMPMPSAVADGSKRARR